MATDASRFTIAKAGNVGAARSSFAGRPSIAIRLRDDGPVFSPSVRARLFDPLLEGPKGESGVGLALAREAAATLDGELSLESGDALVLPLREAGRRGAAS